MKPESRDALPWSPPLARRRKGVVHLPASHDLDSRDRDALLTAIAKARSWIDDLINGRVQSFDEIADREQKVVRHIRFLVPLAFLSPRIVAAIANGDVPAGVTVSGLVRSCLSIGRSSSGYSLSSKINPPPTSRLAQGSVRRGRLCAPAAVENRLRRNQPSPRPMRTESTLIANRSQAWRSKNSGDSKTPTRDWAPKPA